MLLSRLHISFYKNLLFYFYFYSGSFVDFQWKMQIPIVIFKTNVINTKGQIELNTTYTSTPTFAKF